jgi:hypothetical protein
MLDEQKFLAALYELDHERAIQLGYRPAATAAGSGGRERRTFKQMPQSVLRAEAIMERYFRWFGDRLDWTRDEEQRGPAIARLKSKMPGMVASHGVVERAFKQYQLGRWVKPTSQDRGWHGEGADEINWDDWEFCSGIGWRRVNRG